MNSIRIFLLSLLVLLIGTPLAASQSLLTSGSGSALDSVTVESEDIRKRASAAFDTTLNQRLADAHERLADIEDTPGSADEQAKKARQGFREELDTLLPELRGDGILDAGEVSTRVGEARSQFLTEFEQAIDALADGSNAPPLRRNSNSTWAYFKELARYSLLERNSAWDWAAVVASISLAVLIAWLIKKLLDAVEARFRQHEAELWAEAFDSFDGPLYTLAIVLGLLAAVTWLWIPGVAGDQIYSALNLLLMLALGWLLWSLCSPVAAALAGLFKRTYTREIDNHFAAILRRVLRVLVLIAVLMLIAHVLAGAAGIGGFLAGLGLLGVALALVLKGTLDNIVSSFTIFADKPFKMGDLLDYNGQWGHVEDIGFRSTRLRTLTGHLLTVPNAELLETSVDNVSERPFIRRRFRLGLVYSTPAEKVDEAIKILENILQGHDSEPEEEPPRVYFEEFGAYELRLFVQYCYQPPEFWQALEFDSKINREILQRFNEAGIEFAFPTQTNLLQTDNNATPSLRLEGIGGTDSTPGTKD